MLLDSLLIENDGSNDEEDENILSNSEAVKSFKKCLSLMERQNNVNAIQIMQLQRMMAFSVRM